MQHIVATIYDKKGNILAKGVNSYTKTHPLQYRYACKAGNPLRPYLHAEIDAIRKLKDKASCAHTIYIERYWKDGTPAIAKPCPICQMAIEMLQIPNVIYTGV